MIYSHFFWGNLLKQLDFVQFSSVAQSCSILCNPMNCSTPGLPVHHQLPEFTQTHVHRVSDAIQPFHPLSSVMYGCVCVCVFIVFFKHIHSECLLISINIYDTFANSVKMFLWIVSLQKLQCCGFQKITNIFSKRCKVHIC